MATLTKMVISFAIQDAHLRQFQTEFPDIDFVVCIDPYQLQEALNGAEALFGNLLPPDALAANPSLRWMQSTSAGMDRTLTPELIEHDIVITNYSGPQASAIAEHIMAMMFVFCRGLLRIIHAQGRGEWTTQPPEELPRLPQTRYYARFTSELRYQTLAIVGLGDVGAELAWRAKGVGMRVLGSNRRGGAAPAGVDALYGPDNWREMLSEADHFVICVPLTSETTGMIGPAELSAMKSTAVIHNISRGEIIDQNALIAALENGVIAGAGLDVTMPEPLPPDSPLWYMPNVLITSHTSGASPHIEERGTGIALENIRRYLAGEPLLNLVDKHAGY